MTSERAERRTFHLSPRLTVEITVGAGGMTCEWIPRQPPRLSTREAAVYRAARDEMTQLLADMLGGAVLTVEAATGKAILHEPKR